MMDTTPKRLPGRLHAPLLLATLAAMAVWTVPCRADLIVEVPQVQVAPGTNGSFDVLLTNSGPSGVDVAAFNVELSLAGPPGVQFTGATIGTATPYIFQVSSTSVPGGLPLSLDTFPNTQFTASDAEFSLAGFDTIAPGETVGLAHVLFSVDANALAGSGAINVVPSGTLITDVNENGITPAALNGTFTVVPEPSTFVLLAFGVAAVALRRRSRNQPPGRA
jgi:hypothetical protein